MPHDFSLEDVRSVVKSVVTEAVSPINRRLDKHEIILQGPDGRNGLQSRVTVLEDHDKARYRIQTHIYGLWITVVGGIAVLLIYDVMFK